MPMVALMLIEITFVEKLHQFVIYSLHTGNQNPVYWHYKLSLLPALALSSPCLPQSLTVFLGLDLTSTKPGPKTVQN